MFPPKPFLKKILHIFRFHLFINEFNKNIGIKVSQDTFNVSRLLVKENRIYIRGEFTRKKCKTAILLYCFHTAAVLHIFMLYNLLGPGISFYRKSKINVKRKPNYEIGWFIIDQ